MMGKFKAFLAESRTIWPRGAGAVGVFRRLQREGDAYAN